MKISARNRLKGKIVEVVLGATVLDRYDRETFDQIGQVADHAVGVDGLALAGHDVLAVLEELGRGAVEADIDVVARLEAGGGGRGAVTGGPELDPARRGTSVAFRGAAIAGVRAAVAAAFSGRADVADFVGRDTAAINQALLREGVIVRPMAGYRMPNFLRVSIGLPRENARFLEALAKVLSA